MQDLKQTLLNWTGTKVLMTIYPHPDDETMAAGGLIILARSLGWKVVVVTLTRGGAGQIHTHLKGRTLKQIREMELKKSLEIFNVSNLELGDYTDGSLLQEKRQWSRWLSEVIKKHNPGIVTTYDHSGITGHPDHIVLSLEVKKLAKNRLLLWNTLPGYLVSKVAHPEILDYIVSPTHVLDLRLDWVKKWHAARAHKSQALGKNLPVPLWLVFAKYHYEWYHQVNASSNYSHKFVDFKI